MIYLYYINIILTYNNIIELDFFHNSTFKLHQIYSSPVLEIIVDTFSFLFNFFIVSHLIFPYIKMASHLGIWVICEAM